MSSASSPCAACKVRRCKCTQECIFAPYFPPDQPQKFANVHNVFGASNVAKLLSDLEAMHREDAVNSLVYEAEFRLRDPVYGCVGLIAFLQHRLGRMHGHLYNAKQELAGYIGPQGMLSVMQQHPNPGNPLSPSGMGIPTGPSGQFRIPDLQQEHHQIHQIRQQQQQQQIYQIHQQQLFEAQQSAARVVGREEQEMIRALEQKQQQTEYGQGQGLHPQLQPLLYNSFGLTPSLSLGSFDSAYHLQPECSEHPHSHHNHQLFLQPSSQAQQYQFVQQQQADDEQDRIVGPDS